jgi:ATP-dependent DNA ligase
VDWLQDLDPELRDRVKRTPTPTWIEPMNATLTDARFDDPEWIFERKLDGWRYLAFVSGGEAKLLTRNKIPHAFPDVEAALRAQPFDDFIVDGEMVGGVYSVFDVPRFDGHDVTGLPLYARKRLFRYFEWRKPLAVVGLLPGTGLDAYAQACREGWEGVMAKRIDSVYEHKRSKQWLKMKCDAGQEFVVGGFTDPSGARVGFGALLIGYYDGDDFVYAGKLGTGFNTRLLRDLHARMQAIEIPVTPFTRGTGLPKKGAHWVRPEIVVDSVFMEWTSEGKRRHPRFVRVRDDKSPRDVVRERPTH